MHPAHSFLNSVQQTSAFADNSDTGLPFIDLVGKSFQSKVTLASMRSCYTHLSTLAARNSPYGLSAGSVCTGSGLGASCTETVIGVICDACCEAHIPVHHTMICEYDKEKQLWLNTIPSFDAALKVPDVCLFGNDRVVSWNSTKARDLDISLDVLDAGFSCRDLSALSGRKNDMVVYIKKMLSRVDKATMTIPLEKDEVLEGTTLPTLLGTLRCVLQSRPGVLWLENVPGVMEILEDINALLRFLGYINSTVDTDALNYMHAESRPRIKMLYGCDSYLPGLRRLHGLRRDDFSTIWASRIRSIAEGLKCQERQDLADFLLHPDSEELKQIVSMQSRPSMTIDPTWKWIAKHDEYFKAIGLPGRPGEQQYQKFRLTLDHPISKMMWDKTGPRMRDMWIYFSILVVKNEMHGAEFCVDISQNLWRTHCHTDVCCCLTGSSRVLLVKHQRILTGKEGMLLQGLNFKFAPALSSAAKSAEHNNLYLSLSGNSFACGSAMCALMSLLLSHDTVLQQPLRLKRKRDPFENAYLSCFQ